jgi:hypothetical protein
LSFSRSHATLTASHTALSLAQHRAAMFCLLFKFTEFPG